MNNFGAAVRRLLGEHGMSQNELAARSHWDRGYLSRVINGLKPGTHALAADLDRVLAADGELLGIWTAENGSPALAALTDPGRAGSAAPDASAVLARWDAVHEPSGTSYLAAGQAGAAEITRLEDTARMFRVWDHERGGGLNRQAAAGQLADLAALIGTPHPLPLRRRLLSVASMLALTVASMSADSGDTAAAYGYLGAALEAAREARDPVLGARAANAIARRMLDDGDAPGALELLRHARASLQGLPAEMTALLATGEAWTCAASGDYEHMAPCLNLAAETTGAAGSFSVPPSWPASPGPASSPWRSGPARPVHATRSGPRKASRRRCSCGNLCTRAAGHLTLQDWRTSGCARAQQAARVFRMSSFGRWPRSFTGWAGQLPGVWLRGAGEVGSWGGWPAGGGAWLRQGSVSRGNRVAVVRRRLHTAGHERACRGSQGRLARRAGAGAGGD
jgi:transcriptional regulator with XRE-family HTH domain